MEYKYLVFLSVTYSLKGMSALSRKGIPSRLEKIKYIPSLGGCGYALAVKEEYLQQAVSILESENMTVTEILDGDQKT